MPLSREELAKELQPIVEAENKREADNRNYRIQSLTQDIVRKRDELARYTARMNESIAALQSELAELPPARVITIDDILG